MFQKHYFCTFILTTVCLLHITPEAGTVNEDKPQVWLSDFEYWSRSDGSVKRYMNSSEYTGFRGPFDFATSIISKLHENNEYRLLASGLEAFVFSCQSDKLPVVWKLAGTSGWNFPQSFPTRSSIFNSTMEEPLNKIFVNRLAFQPMGQSAQRPANVSAVCYSTVDSSLKKNLKIQTVNNTSNSKNSSFPVTPEISENRNMTFYANFSAPGNLKWAQRRDSSRAYFVCCTGVPEKPPVSLALVHCRGPLGCGTGAIKKLRKKEEAQSRLNGTKTTAKTGKQGSEGCTALVFDVVPSVLVSCKGDNVDLFQEYVTTFSNAVTNGTSDIFNFIPVSDAVNLNSSSKILLRLAKRATVKSGVSSAIVVADPNPLCNLDLEEVGSVYSSVLHREDSSLEVVPLEAEVAEGEEVHVTCFYLSYFYTNGARLRLNWRNGTKSVLRNSNHKGLVIQPLRRFYDPVKKYFGPPVLRKVISGKILVHSDMKSVDCFVPHLRGSGWDKQTFVMNSVKPAIPPKFSGAEEETVELGGSETTAEFSCQVTAFPVADIQIFLNDMRIDNWPAVTVTTNFSLESPKYKVRKTVAFNADSEFYGDYKCVAEGLGLNTAVKLIRVVAKG